MLRSHGAAVEADLARYYGVELADVGTDRLSWRRLWSLVQHLPPGSATDRAQRGPQADWATHDYLLANVVDLLQAANWQRAGRKNAPRPKPFPRPGVATAGAERYGDRKPHRRRITLGQMDRVITGWSDHRPGRSERSIAVQ